MNRTSARRTDEQKQTRMKLSVRIYVALVLSLGAGLLLATRNSGDPSPPAIPLVTVGFWFFLSMAAECFWLETPTRDGTISMSLAVNMATLFVLPPPLVLVVGGLSVGLSDLLLRRRGWLRALFNGTQTMISLAASLLVIRLLAGPGQYRGNELFLQQPLATLAAPVVFFWANTLLVSGVLSLQGARGLWETWKENYGFGYQVLSSGTLFLLGMILVVASESLGYISGLLCLLLFFFVRDAYHRYVLDRVRRLGRA